MAGKTHGTGKSKLKHEAQEMLAQADPDTPGMPSLASSMPVGSISHPGRKRAILWVVVAVVIVAAIAAAIWYASQTTLWLTDTKAPAKSASPAPSTEQQLALDTSKNYGNKYASGMLPVGDNMYTTSGAKKGYMYACDSYAKNLAQGGGGASSRGPWFVGTTQYDINKKVSVSGHVDWKPSFSDTVAGATRIILSNDLPSHYTGTYPIAAKDPAYAYDRNPNSIKAQSDTYALTADPSYGAPQCMGGQVGVMLTGVALFNAFDAGGRDAGAWEVQDGCSGHPEKTGEYHYHTLSRCITDVGAGTVIGFALDGFPITGPKVGDNNFLTTSDLDECHGITSAITLDGKMVTMYHYVMTQDFPYSVSCFRAKAIQPPGLAVGGGQQTGGSAQPAQGTPPPQRKPPIVPPRG